MSSSSWLPGRLAVNAKLQGEARASIAPNHHVVGNIAATIAQEQKKVERGAPHRVCFFFVEAIAKGSKE